MPVSYRSLFCIITFVVANNTLNAENLNPTLQKPSWPTLQNFVSARFLNGLACIGACTCFFACFTIVRYVYNRYRTPRPQPTLAEWIAKLEEHSHPSQTIDPAIQKAAHHFIMTEYHNKALQQVAVSKVVTDNNPFYALAPLLEDKNKNYFKMTDSRPYNITIEKPNPEEGSPRFDFIVHRGNCISVTIEQYENGTYRTSLYHPRNQSDAIEGNLWLQRANAMVHAQQRYDTVQTQW